MLIPRNYWVSTVKQLPHQESRTDFSIESALHHRDHNSFANWVDAFLRGPGSNVPLADGLLRAPRWWFGPAQFPLDRLVLKCGPGLEYHEDPADWDRRVSELLRAIDLGTELPPLIAEYRDGVFLLADGNHRHGALTQKGMEKYWTAIWFNSAVEYDRYVDSLHS
jgi:hypothetical protein